MLKKADSGGSCLGLVMGRNLKSVLITVAGSPLEGLSSKKEGKSTSICLDGDDGTLKKDSG